MTDRRHWGSTICCENGRCAMPDAHWHGTPGGYSNHQCRCEACTQANTDYYRTGKGAVNKRAYRARLLAAGQSLQGSWAKPKPRKNKYTPRRSKPK